MEGGYIKGDEDGAWFHPEGRVKEFEMSKEEWIEAFNKQFDNVEKLMYDKEIHFPILTVEEYLEALKKLLNK